MAARIHRGRASGLARARGFAPPAIESVIARRRVQPQRRTRPRVTIVDVLAVDDGLRLHSGRGWHGLQLDLTRRVFHQRAAGRQVKTSTHLS